MTKLFETAHVTCPSCWNQFEVEVDCVEGSQDCYEDCPVCCSPVHLNITFGNEAEYLGAEAQPGNE